MWEVGEVRYLDIETNDIQIVGEKVCEYMSKFSIPEVWVWEWEIKQLAPNRYRAIIIKEK